MIQRHEMEPVLYMFHNDPTAGHFSTDKMFDKIKSRYYWPQMYDDIKRANERTEWVKQLRQSLYPVSK